MLHIEASKSIRSASDTSSPSALLLSDMRLNKKRFKCWMVELLRFFVVDSTPEWPVSVMDSSNA